MILRKVCKTKFKMWRIMKLSINQVFKERSCLTLPVFKKEQRGVTVTVEAENQINLHNLGSRVNA